MSRVLEDTLVRFELPYQVIGGTKFYERAEIKDAVAYLSLLVNPSDQVSFAARRQLAAARDRQHHPGAARRPTRTPPGCRSGRWSTGSRRCRAWAPPRSRRLAASTRRSRALRERAERGAPVAELLRGGAQRDAATWKRSRPSARSRPRAGSRTSRS